MSNVCDFIYILENDNIKTQHKDDFYVECRQGVELWIRLF